MVGTSTKPPDDMTAIRSLTGSILRSVNPFKLRAGRALALGLLSVTFLLALPSSVNSATDETLGLSSPPASVTPQGAPIIDKWRRHVISFQNTSYTGNPFELEIDATFTHPGTGTTLTLPGYYDGNDTWKIGFMPTETGPWDYVTASLDPDLNNVTGSLSVVDSGLPGILKADPSNPRKWKYSEGPYVLPMSFRLDLFTEDGTDQRITEIADFLADQVGGQMLEGRLTREVGAPTFPIFAGNWQDHKFDLANWDRFNRRLDILAARGLGFHLMFYSDDGGTPAWGAQSATEQLLMRYTVARVAGYHTIVFNTGIDIIEYRPLQSWYDWFGQEIKNLDPYGHPISSRYGGGSGNLVMQGQTFDSRGDKTAIINDMTGYFAISNVPVSMDDAWSENAPEAANRNKDFTEHDIRRAVWKAVVSGGLGVLIRGTNLMWGDLYFRIADFETDLESEQFLVNVNPFVQTKLGTTFGQMVPAPSLVTNGFAIADPARTKIMYFLMGVNDRYDAGNGGDITVHLAGLSGSYSATWYDTRLGTESLPTILTAGTSHVLTPPSTDDWVLLLNSGTQPTNQAPQVNAGLDQTIVMPVSASLSGTVSDDGLPSGSLSSSWSKVSGPGTVTFTDASSAITSATFSTDGGYVLRLTADDGSLSANDDVAITVVAQPAGACPTLPSVGIAAQDLDGDGLCEDLNSNSRFDFDDVVKFFQYQGSPAFQASPELDFNLNGLMDSDDIVTLFGDLVAFVTSGP